MIDATVVVVIVLIIITFCTDVAFMVEAYQNRKERRSPGCPYNEPATKPIILPFALREPTPTWIPTRVLANQLKPGDMGYAVRSAIHINKRGECFLFAKGSIYGIGDNTCSPKNYLVVRCKTDGTMFVSCKEMEKKPWYSVPTEYIFSEDIPISELDY
jgi:hypothetical protein